MWGWDGEPLTATQAWDASLAADLSEEVAVGELVVVGEDGSADQDAAQDLVVVGGGESGKLVLAGVSGGEPGAAPPPAGAGPAPGQ
jgi:hypothetical protein